jgi:ribosomal protein S8
LKSQQRIAKKYGYITGWNIIPTHEECIEYLKLFKKLENKEIVKCQATDVWEKPTKNKVTVLLAKEIFIEEFV